MRLHFKGDRNEEEFDYDEPSLALINAKIDDLVAEFDGSNAQELKDLFGVYLKQFVTPAQREALKELLLNSYDASLYEEQEQNELLAKIDDLLLTFDGYNEDEILDEFITFRNTKRTAYGKHIDRFEALNLDGDNPLELKNVAVGGTVWTNSTSYNQGTPELVNDGSRDTGIFQDSNANPLDDLVVRIDFDAVKSVKAARIYWGTINNYADSFKVEVSLDGVNWDAIYVVNGQTLYSENLFNKICLEESVNARYIQFVGIKRSKIYGYGFREFQVYGEDVVLPRLSAVSGLEYDVNDNVGKTIYVSYTQNADETLTPAWNAVSFIANIYQGEELVKTIANISNPSNTSGGTLSFDIIGLPLGDYTLKLIALGDYVHNSSSLESEGITITVTELAKLEAPSDVYIENGRIYFMDNNPDLDNVVYNLVFNDGITTITIEDVVFGGKFDTTNLVDSTTYMVKLVALREGYASSSSEEIEFTYEAPTTPSVKMEGKRVYLYGYVYRQSESRLVLKFADDFFGHYRVYGDNGGFQVDYTKCKLYINDIEVPAYTWKKNYGAWIQADALGDLSTFTFAEFKIQMYDLNGNPFYVQFETESATSNEIKFADPLMSSRMSAITSVIAYNYSPTSSTYHFASYSKEDNEAINVIFANYLEELFDLELTDTAGKINSLRDATLAQIATFEKLVEVKPQEVVEASTDNGKEKLIDGSTASSNTWEGLKSDNEKPYFVVDLGEVVDLEHLLIYCNSASNVPSAYKVLVSEDGETYVEVVSDVWYQSTAGYLDAWINSNARYVKVEFELLGSKVNVQEIYFIGR